MRVLHGSGRQPVQQARFRSNAAAALIVLATATFAVAAEPLAVLAMLPALALAAHQGVRQLRQRRRSRLGERLVTNLLRPLSNDYYLVNDVPLERGAHARHVLIGPSGVLVIEARRIRGRVVCYGDEWHVNGRRRRSFGRHARAEAAAVEGALRRWCPEAAAALGRVEALLVFTYPRSHVQAYWPRTMVVRYSQVLGRIQELESRRQMSAATARRLAQTLALGPDRVADAESPLAAALGR